MTTTLRPKPIAAFLLASVAALVLTGCPHHHRDHYPPPPDHHDQDHGHDQDHSHDHDHDNHYR